MKNPKLFVLSAPSGCGKTTIAHAIMERRPEILFSVSATSRSKRENEVHGKDYFFLSKKEFEECIQQENLVEWELIYGNYYGTLKREVDRALENGVSMMFDIDVNGALSIKKHYPDDSVLIFIEPPSIEILIQRLTNRNTENNQSLQKRIERIPMEMERRFLFDARVINDDLTRAISEVDALVLKHIGVEEPYR